MEIKELTVSLSKKVSKDYDSKGVSVSVTVDLKEGDDKDAEYAALASWCAAKIGGTLKAHGALPSETAPEGPWLKDMDKKAPQPGRVAQIAPAQPDDGVVKGPLTFAVETLSVEVKGGKRYTKAKGGHFVMYGVNVWPEVLALPPLEWDAETLDGADYDAPKGLTAIYTEKAITTKDGVEKMVPDKVTGWA